VRQPVSEAEMPERWILNASPLIVLAHIGYEDLLLTLTDQVVIPRAVASEIEAGPVEDQAKQALATGRFTIRDTPSPPEELLGWNLGSGETAVLSFAMVEEGWTAILDDASARKCARSFSLPVKGTLAVVLLAKQRGLISSAATILHSLRSIGFRLDDQTIQEALQRTVGEEWLP
jgi:predicted nucleic acid-binding protein